MENYLELYNTHEGTSQRTRLDANLLPENFRIDGRTSIDLVRFAIEFSKSLNYYNTDSSISRDWKDFFIKDRIIYLYIIANTNLDEAQQEFYQAFEYISNLTDPGDISSHMHMLISPFHGILDLLASWNSNLDPAEPANEGMINIPKFLMKEDIIDGIRKAHKISRDSLPGANWETIRKNFFLDLAPEKGYEFDESDPGLIKSAFEETFLLSKQIIKNANAIISGKFESGQNVRPNVALFLGFLKIYNILRDRMNAITGKHLDFYYEEVLRLSRHGLTPDETFVRFELNKDTDSHYLEEGTAVLGGKDRTGAPIVYRTLEGIQLSGSKIASLYTLFVSQNPLNYTGLGNKQAVSDIFFKKHDPANIGSLKIFGEDQFFKASSERTMETARVGFIVASEHLKLTEGDRTICIDIIATGKSYRAFKELIDIIDRTEKAERDDPGYTFYQVFNTAFDLYLVLDGMEIKYEQYMVTDNTEENGIRIEIELPADRPALTGLKSVKVPGQPEIHDPYIKILLREESHIYAFPLINALEVINVRLGITVAGMKNFMLFNNYGQIDYSLPFQVFGAVPKANSYFLLGSPELFGKPVKKIDIDLNWYQLPSDPDGWQGYFDGYGEDIRNSDFKVEIAYLNSGSWKKIKPHPVYPLFEEEVRDGVRLKSLSEETHFHDMELPVDPSETKDGENFQPYNLKTRCGYLKFELVEPAFGFGFSSYSKNLYQTITKNAKMIETGDIKQPNPPFSPVIKSISVNYYAEAEMIGEKGPGDNIHLFSLGPAGYLARELKSDEKPVGLLPDLEPEGHLLIGLDKYPQDGLIRFYILTKASNLESYIHDVPVPKWQYLAGNHWEDMPPDFLHLDGTMGFIQSGIISMKIPPAISNENTLTNDRFYWIKASIDRNTHIIPEVTGIWTNVARVRWDKQSDGSHLGMIQAGNTISKMQKLDPKITGILQVSDLFRGKPEESKTEYYVRTSERLRHKMRASTAWDYERLVLEKFPFVFKVKCFNALPHKDEKKKVKGFIEPGKVLIAVTPDITDPYITDMLQPKFGISVLIRIRDYLQGISSPFVKIDVRNPYYESVQVICRVKFKENLNHGHYIEQLNRELTEYLTPWIQASDEDEQFGGSQYRSKIMAFVSQRDYVDFVTSFSVIKINEGQDELTLFDSARTEGNNEIITPAFPWSILTSVPKHDIRLVEDPKYQPPVPRGIDNMKLGFDFVLEE